MARTPGWFIRGGSFILGSLVTLVACTGLFLLVVLLVGCRVGDGVGEVAGELFVVGCGSDGADLGSSQAPVAYDLQPGFFAGEPVPGFPTGYPRNSLRIRIQRTGAFVEANDALIIHLENLAEAARRMTMVPVGPFGPVHATLNLPRTCPGSFDTPTVDGGWITFSQLGSALPGSTIGDDFELHYGERVAARFDFPLVDERARIRGGAPRVGGRISGYFDFIVRRGHGAQELP